MVGADKTLHFMTGMTWVGGILVFTILHGILVPANAEVFVQELYNKETNYSIACGVCTARKGSITQRPQLDDWEITFGNLSFMANMSFWVDLHKEVTTQTWFWGNQNMLNLTETASLPLMSDFDAYINSSWTCAVWNMAEPFLKQVPCSSSANIMCSLPSSLPECTYTETNGMMLNASNLTLQVKESVDECIKACETQGNCWAADFNMKNNSCRLMTSNDGKPDVPDIVNNGDYSVIGKTCATYKMASDSDFICNCAAIQLPETPEERKEYEEHYTEQVKKELIVEKDTLSATVRKKISVPDERKSSTGLGYMGISMLAVVFGGLVLLDLASLIAHAKLAYNNIRGLFVNDSSDV